METTTCGTDTCCMVYCYSFALQTDINECELKEVNDCQQDCTNTVGSFNCSCQEGFTLNADGKNCDGISLLSLGSRLFSILIYQLLLIQFRP